MTYAGEQDMKCCPGSYFLKITFLYMYFWCLVLLITCSKRTISPSIICDENLLWEHKYQIPLLYLYQENHIKWTPTIYRNAKNEVVWNKKESYEFDIFKTKHSDGNDKHLFGEKNPKNKKERTLTQALE